MRHEIYREQIGNRATQFPHANTQQDLRPGLNSFNDSYHPAIPDLVYAARRVVPLPVACFPQSIPLIYADSKWLPFADCHGRVPRCNQANAALFTEASRRAYRLEPSRIVSLCWPIAARNDRGMPVGGLFDTASKVPTLH